jgi:2',3'-cyclic-nucleotide 2'-phosphodiesterase (5'-nucleotidase family)
VIRSSILGLAALLLAAAAPAAPETIYLNILHTNDIHGGIAPTSASFINPDFPPMMGGGAYVSSYVKEVRESCRESGEHCLLVDAGDIYQGTPLGNFDSGRLIVEWMNYVEYDVMTLGNHDFDDGAENAVNLARMADFPVVCCNFLCTETGRVPDPVRPYILRELEGIEIALVGVNTPDTYGLVDPSLLEGYLFGNEVESVGRAIEWARSEGADVVILISHLGQPPDPERYLDMVLQAWRSGSDYTKDWALNNVELSTVLSGIDVIVSGHIHIGYEEPWINPINHTLVVQGYANGTGIGHIRLALDTETESLVGYDLPYGEEYISLFHDEFWPDPGAAEMIEGFRDLAEAGMDEVIGEAEEEIPRGPAEHPLGRLVADAMAWRTGADVALMNRGGIRAVIPRGPVTPRIVYQAIPFQEDLYVLELSGEELVEVLEAGMAGRRRDMEISGISAVRNQSMPDGRKMEELLIGGEPVRPDETYELVTTGYLASGNIGYEVMLQHTGRYTGITLLDAVVDYISEHSPIRADDRTRVIWKDE